MLSLHIILHDLFCFPIVVKALQHGFISIYNVLPALKILQRSYVLLTMQWSVASSTAFYRGRENIYEYRWLSALSKPVDIYPSAKSSTLLIV